MREDWSDCDAVCPKESFVRRGTNQAFPWWRLRGHLLITMTLSGCRLQAAARRWLVSLDVFAAGSVTTVNA